MGFPTTRIVISIVCACQLVITAQEDAASDVQSRQRRHIKGTTSCHLHDEGQMFADPDDCKAFIQCSGGFAYKMTCPTGLYYEPEKKICDFHGASGCSESKKESSDGTVAYSIQNDSPLATIYISTDNQQGSSVETNFGFEERTKISRPTQNRVNTENDAANYCSEQIYGIHADPTDCRKYLLCNAGHAYPVTCADGLAFNPAVLGCDYDIGGMCGNAAQLNVPVDLPPSSSLATVLSRTIEQVVASLQQVYEIEARTAAEVQPVGERPFQLVQRFLYTRPMAKVLSIPSFVLRNATSAIVASTGWLQKGNLLDSLKLIPAPIAPYEHTLSADDPFPLPEPNVCPWPKYRCASSPYRSIDGSCNNLGTPIWGRSFTPFRRNLPANYADRIGEFRVAKSGRPLPSARLVSDIINEDMDMPSDINALSLMDWGQFLDHDMGLASLSQIVQDASSLETAGNLVCGADGCSVVNEACVPIPVSPSDSFFKGFKCLEFIRSQSVPRLNCTVAPREQLNQITAYLDLSLVYGNVIDETVELRELNFDRGRMRVTPHPTDPSRLPYLPTTPDDEECNLFNSPDTCFLGGDVRVNERSGLTVLHTLFVREHNRIEEELNRLNPHWDGETLFQEARKIAGGLYQHINYKEYLGIVLGPTVMEQYELTVRQSGFFTGYDGNLDATVANVFTTAAFRYGHSLVPPVIRRLKKDFSNSESPMLRLSQVFFRPAIFFENPDSVDMFLRGSLASSSQEWDRFLTTEVTNHLFAESPPNGPGTDLASLNIQRARDHGISPYNDWREWCGLERARDFDDLLDMPREARQLFKRVYESVDDIDVFPAGLAESSVSEGLVGPTFACLIGDQFRRFRKGDRFWYENVGVFTEGQLTEIRKASLARLICDNSDHIEQVQPEAMKLPFREAYGSYQGGKLKAMKQGLSPEWFSQLWQADLNSRVNCSCLPKLDLSKWATLRY